MANINWRITDAINTEANWIADNPILLAGEHAVSSDQLHPGTDQPKYKIGNGVDRWADLDYYPTGGAGAVSWGTITGTLSNQTDLNTALTNLQSNINNVDSDLGSHLNNYINPHKTTLAQVVSENNFLPADITGGNDFVLRPDSTTPGAASAVIEKGNSWMYINAGQVWIGDKVQNIGYYANIGAGDTGIYNASGGVTVEASGSINMGGGVVTNVADAVGATDAVNKLQLDGKQNQLNGTGFVKATGTTISYDSNSYIVENTWINYTPVWTGFSVNPTVNAGDAQYLVRGKMCLVRLRPSAGGTSNATTLTVTLPFVSAVTNNPQIFNGIIQNNGTVSNNPARIEVASNSNIATAYTNNQLGAFTASGTKTVLFQIEYQLP